MHSQDHSGSDGNPFCVGVDQPIKSVLDSISPTHDSPKASPRPKRQSVAKNEPEFDFDEENIQQPRITLKPLSKKIVEESLKENLDVLEEEDEEKTVKEEDRVKEEPDALDESADKSGPSGRGARRRTVATTGSTSKEPKKEAKTPKLIRRKSIQVIPPPNANPIVSFRLYYFDNNKMYLVPLGVR